MSNIVNNLYQDLQSNDTWNTEFNNFINNLTNEVGNYLGYVNPNSITGQGFWTQLSNIISTCFSGQLGNWTYAYDTQTLLTLWTNNTQQIALNIVANAGLYLVNFSNGFINAIVGNNQTVNTISGNNFGDVNTSANSSYHAETSLNNNSSNNLSSINSNFNQSGSEGGFNYQWNPQGTNSYVNGVNVGNNAMSNDTTPLKQSDGTFSGNTTNNLQGVQIATFLEQNYKSFEKKIQEVLYDTFKVYLLPFNDIDNNVEGFNW